MNLCALKVQTFRPSIMSQTFQWSVTKQQFDDPSKRCDLCLSLCIVGNGISAAVAQWVTSALYPAWLANVTTVINYDTEIWNVLSGRHTLPMKQGRSPSGYRKRLIFLIAAIIIWIFILFIVH